MDRVVCVGSSHRCAPVDILERLSMAPEQRDAFTADLLSLPTISEAMVVSTCNRFEVYAVLAQENDADQMGDDAAMVAAHTDILDVIAQHSAIPVSDVRAVTYTFAGTPAAEHLIRVAAGLESMVVGEQQIIGQVRQAYRGAGAGPVLHSIAQSALRAGKRVHSETEIDDAGASMVSLAFEVAGITSLRGRRVLVLGAGVMASLAATHAGRLEASELVIANRTRSRAEALAEHARQAGVPARVVDFDARAHALDDVDVVISATGARSYTIRGEDVAASKTRVGQRAPLFIDLSMPRDIQDSVEDHGATLVNIPRLGEHHHQVSATGEQMAEQIVAEELSQVAGQLRARRISGDIAAVRRRGDAVVAEELSRITARLGLSEQQAEEMHSALRRVADKLLHEPIVQAKRLVEADETVESSDVLQRMFALNER